MLYFSVQIQILGVNFSSIILHKLTEKLIFFFFFFFFWDSRLFLMGLKKYGKGDWRNISRNFVMTRTPTQVASHAQKYFLRLSSGGKDKRRSSIHDITTANIPDNNSKLASSPPPLLVGETTNQLSGAVPPKESSSSPSGSGTIFNSYPNLQTGDFGNQQHMVFHGLN